MEDFKKNQQIQLADGKMYLYINTVPMDGHSYHFLSPLEEDKFIIAEMIKEDEKRFLKVIQDRSTIERIQEYYKAHPDSLLIAD